MPDYFVFGGCLRSELPFPELTETGGRTPDWTLNVARLAPNDGAEILSDASLSRTCHIRISRSDSAFRYSHSCTGTFQVSSDGRHILFDAIDGGDLNAARTDFVSRVLLYCVNHGGVTWLHGSAVRIANSAVAFLGPSGAGKSTLALALTRAGAQHICDDTLPVEGGPEPIIWPSDHVIRLHSDSRQHLASETTAIRRETDGKFLLKQVAVCAEGAAISRGELGSERTRLGAVYLLNPVPMSESSRLTGAGVTRRLLSPRSAVPSLLQHIKLGPVIRAEDPAHYMQQLGEIVGSVPVFELRVPRDWAAVDMVVEQLMAWHIASGVNQETPISSPLPVPA
jgi:energy-coupling factor transporter ATP-binding protein EcfA2